ncbi:MAG: Gfo/Idh/MocA family oxidoreductase [Streptococcaceae bacterium]|jgi:predicted dehydrogenase|nr:Gfo/Idh/MocA family oxidoreductase [Streptococcaceae bacterium]
MTKVLNIAYVGFGKSTNRYHIPYVLTRPDQFHIARVIVHHLGGRPLEEAALKKAQGTIFSDDITDALADPEIDLIDIVTPFASHYSLAKAALEAGKNVLCDKPLVATGDEARELVDLANEKHLFFMPFQNRRFDSDFLTVKKVLEGGYLGNLLDITVNMDHYRPNDITKGGPYDGAWYGHGVHLVDQMVSLFGAPQKVYYDIRSSRDAKAADDYFLVNLLYEGFRATIAASETSVIPHPKWILYGDRGTFIKETVDQQENDLKLNIMPGSPGFGEDSPFEFGRLVYMNQNGDRIEKAIPTVVGDYARVYDSVYETLVNQAPKLVSDSELLSVLEILEAGIA